MSGNITVTSLIQKFEKISQAIPTPPKAAPAAVKVAHTVLKSPTPAPKAVLVGLPPKDSSKLPEPVVPKPAPLAAAAAPLPAPQPPNPAALVAAAAAAVSPASKPPASTSAGAADTSLAKLQRMKGEDFRDHWVRIKQMALFPSEVEMCKQFVVTKSKDACQKFFRRRFEESEKFLKKDAEHDLPYIVKIYEIFREQLAGKMGGLGNHECLVN